MCVCVCVCVFPVVDWEEETPGDVLPVPVLVPARPQQPQHSRAAPEVVALVGGCTVSPAEHRKFEDFKRGGHVRKWYVAPTSVAKAGH
ncbi:hypothetical protein ONE63_006760 [Megalurothrips usitatus]|uniref:Secreted protein n=1 Tax=Megalurothrips usitatus TaxID=439358 RepID=A0AAV7XSE9_9NEOP|nr:hypothetical protein ONE63_006760 [Megalurothrips usitatus]